MCYFALVPFGAQLPMSEKRPPQTPEGRQMADFIAYCAAGHAAAQLRYPRQGSALRPSSAFLTRSSVHCYVFFNLMPVSYIFQCNGATGASNGSVECMPLATGLDTVIRLVVFLQPDDPEGVQLLPCLHPARPSLKVRLDPF